MPVSTAKTGMLANADIIRAVAEAAPRFGLRWLVVDPVMVAKGGQRLLEPEAERAYVEKLFKLATLITPNLAEASALLGRPIRDKEAMRRAARELKAMGPAAVLVKGGHLEGDAVDVFFDGERLEELTAPRIDTPHTHGTGCTLSAAVTARLALGDELFEAVCGAKRYLTRAIEGAYRMGAGHGPVDHMHPLTGGRSSGA